jgi:hypothetical protein
VFTMLRSAFLGNWQEARSPFVLATDMPYSSISNYLLTTRAVGQRGMVQSAA